MVDESRSNGYYNNLSDESSVEDSHGILNNLTRGKSLTYEKTNSIADYNPQIRKNRKDPNLGRSQQPLNYDDDSSIDISNEEGIEFPVQSKKSRFSTSDDRSDASGSSDYKPKKPKAKRPKNSRVSIRSKRPKVNYNEDQDLSDADYYVSQRSKGPRNDPRNTINPRKKNVDEDEDDDENDSDQDSQLSYNPKESRNGIGAANEDQDVIEEVLFHEIRRIGATGNSSTMYNVRLEKDPNANFDANIEKGELQYLIKWKNWSHIHSTWETETSLNSPDRSCPVGGLKKLQIYKDNMRISEKARRYATDDQLEAIQCEDERIKTNLSKKMEAERIVSHSRDTESNCYDYLVKWCQLEYRHCTWESGRVVEAFYPKIVNDYERRCKSMTLPNPKNPVLRMRPKFQRLNEQPAYLGRSLTNPNQDRLELREYQLNGLNWLSHAWCRGNSVILADEMGLGKTIQTISFLSYLFHTHQLYGPFLLVVPLSTISNWCYECSLWAEEMNTIAYIGDNVSRQLIREHEWSSVSKKNQALKFNVCITTYEILLKDKSWLCNVPWAVLAVDEAHRLKNDQSQLYKNLFTFNTNSRVLVTGTPLQNSLKELWALLHFIMPGEFHDWEEFEEAYSIQNTGESSSEQGDALNKLHRILEPYLLRRVKRDVEYSLPEKIERILRVGMSSRQADMYRMILARNYDGLMRVTNGHKASFVNIMMELKKCCNHASLIAPLDDDHEYMRKNPQERLTQLVRGSGKLMLLDKLLQKLKPNGHRVLIFSQMVRMLDIIATYLELRRWGFQRLDGSISGEDRKQALNHFNAENSTDFCFLLSTRAGGLGINLATADTVVIFDSDWNPQNDLQAQARAHRIGQKKQVSVYRLVTKESIEEKIIESATRKMVLDHLVIQKMDSSGGGNGRNQSKGDTRGKLYSDILKYGAEGLFSHNKGDDNEPEVDIDSILDQAETRQISDETPSNHPANALLSTFSIVNVDNLDETQPVIMNQSSKGAAPLKDWGDIIPDEMVNKAKEEQRESELIQPLGPRNRKPVNSYKAGEDENSNDSDLSNGGRTSSKANSNLSDKEIRAILKSMRKFPHPLKRVDAIIADAELPDRSEREVSSLIETIIRGCRDVLDQPGVEVKTATFTIGKVSMIAKQVINSVEDLEVIEDYLFKDVPEKYDRLKLALPFIAKTVNWNCIWTDIDDIGLLVGICEHGYDNWEAIKLDSDLGLGSKLLPLNGSDRPQTSHIRTRVEYIIKTLRKHQSEGSIKLPVKDKPDKAKSSKSKSKASSKSDRSHDSTGNNNNKANIKKKSDEFVQSDHSSDDDPPKKTSKKQSKKSSSNVPMHFTSNQPISLHEEADKEFSLMKGILFETCKKLMHPIRKLFRRLQKLEDAKEESLMDYNTLVIEIGQHIKQIVKRFSSQGLISLLMSVNSGEDNDLDHEKTVDQLSSILVHSEDMKKYLWKFVQFFSNKTGPQLELLYHVSRKKSSSGGNHHSKDNEQNTSSSRRNHHQNHNHHRDDHDSKHQQQKHSHHGSLNTSGHNTNTLTASTTSSSSLVMNNSNDSVDRFNNAFNRLPTSMQNSGSSTTSHSNSNTSSNRNSGSSRHSNSHHSNYHHSNQYSKSHSYYNNNSNPSDTSDNSSKKNGNYRNNQSSSQHSNYKRSYASSSTTPNNSHSVKQSQSSGDHPNQSHHHHQHHNTASLPTGLSSRDPRLQNHQ